MIISIDESGSFVEAPSTGSWCVVAAYVFQERIQSRTYATLRSLKKRSGSVPSQELKLKDIEEEDYFQFLRELRNDGGLLFAVATDSGLNDASSIVSHRTSQVEKIRKNIPRMKYETGKEAVVMLSDKVESLAPQLYVQLLCQVELIRDVLCQGILYFAQYDPKTLRRFKWRIDQKNTNKTVYEEAAEIVTPGLLQTISFREPMIFLREADYSYFEPYDFSAEEMPEYLEKEVGLERKSTVNLGKILRENMKFPDSKREPSVQIADLLAAGLRRCLRDEFTHGDIAAKLLGSLMVMGPRMDAPVRLVKFSDGDYPADRQTAKRVNLMSKVARGVLIAA